MFLRRTIIALVTLLLLGGAVLFTSGACYSPPNLVVETIIDYIAAVQGKDTGRLHLLRSGVEPPEGTLPGLPHVPAIWEDRSLEPSGNPAFDLLRERAQLAYHLYDKGRERGRLKFSPLGIVLIKGLVLGKGVMYRVERQVEHPDGRVTAFLFVDLNYEQYNYRQLPDGTIVFFMGRPLGTITPGTVGERLKGAVQLLDTLEVRVELVPSPPPSLHGWRVRSFTAERGSETYITVTGQIGNRSWLRD